MITVANRATPRPLTLEQQKNAMTNEGDPNLGSTPELAAESERSAPDATKRAARPIMSLPHRKPASKS